MTILHCLNLSARVKEKNSKRKVCSGFKSLKRMNDLRLACRRVSYVVEKVIMNVFVTCSSRVLIVSNSHIYCTLRR